MSTQPFDWTEFEAEFADPTKHIPFTPVPRLCARRRGWSRETQKAFMPVGAKLIRAAWPSTSPTFPPEQSMAVAAPWSVSGPPELGLFSFVSSTTEERPWVK
jgi:hypothetical protein